MRSVIYEVGSFILLGIIVLALLAAIQHFFPDLIKNIGQYLVIRTPKY